MAHSNWTRSFRLMFVKLLTPSRLPFIVEKNGSDLGIRNEVDRTETESGEYRGESLPYM